MRNLRKSTVRLNPVPTLPRNTGGGRSGKTLCVRDLTVAILIALVVASLPLRAEEAPRPLVWPQAVSEAGPWTRWWWLGSAVDKANITRPLAYHTAGAAACIETYILAMQAAKSTKAEAVRDALASADYETFYSRIKFTPDGDGDPIIMGSMIGQVQKSKLEIVYPEAAASAKAIYPQPAWDKKA